MATTTWEQQLREEYLIEANKPQLTVGRLKELLSSYDDALLVSLIRVISVDAVGVKVDKNWNDDDELFIVGRET